MSYISFQPQDYFNTKLWSGNSSTQAITGVGFQPDFVWGKQRTGTQSHQLLDAIRGANNILTSNTTAAAVADSNILNSFDSDGFTLGNQDQLNDTGATYASWNWKANGQGSSNTDGSINTTYTSANTTSGFSICQYTGNAVIGATVGHGLGVAPKMIIVKETSGTGDWIVYHASIGNTKRLRLNTGAAEETNAFWNDTTPTSSVWSMNDNGDGNGSGSTYIAYCFAEKKGFSAMGSYTGNGNANGPFVYTGMSPAIIIAKKTSGISDWILWDNKRDGYNETIKRVYPNDPAGEESSTTQGVDFLSNGFKLRGTSSNAWNSGSDTYIYMAFAEEPLVSSNGVAATAR